MLTGCATSRPVGNAVTSSRLSVLATTGAKTWYVSTAGKDTNSGLTKALAFATVQHAANLTNPGDTVLIEPGTYHQATVISKSGVAGSPITFKSDGGGVIFDGTGVTSYGDNYGANRGQMFTPSGRFNGQDGPYYIILQNFTIDHAANVQQASGNAAVTTASNWTLNEITVQNSAFAGMGLLGNNVLVENSIAQYNGEEGWAASGTQNLTIKNSTTRFNNPNGSYNSPSYEAGGGKFAGTAHTTIDTVKAYGNVGGPGIWFDWNNTDIVVRNCTVYNNAGVVGSSWLGVGIAIEISPGPANIYNNNIYGNTGSDIGIWESTNVTVTNNTMSVNQWGIDLRDMPGRGIHLSNININNNRFIFEPLAPGAAWMQQAAFAADQSGIGPGPNGPENTTFTNTSGTVKKITIDYNDYEQFGQMFWWSNSGVYSGYSDLPTIRKTLGFETHGTVNTFVTPALVVPVTSSAPPPPTGSATSISQYGITWTFDKAYPVGQFLTGDYWVVGPVKIVSVSPATSGVAKADSSGLYRNGSMVNPMLVTDAPNDYSFTHQAYDDRATQFDATEIVTYPLTLPAGSSLISTQSVPELPFTLPTPADPFPYNAPASFSETAIIDGTALLNSAVLTVLASAPTSNCLRPAFVGIDKIMYCQSQINTAMLPSLPVPASAPNLAIMQRQLARPWTGIARNFVREEITPALNEVSYGRDLSNLIGDIFLSTALNYTPAQKAPLVYGLTQKGIDLFYAVKLDPHLYQPNGGYSSGRKLPILFAGLVLNNQAMLSVVMDSPEDMQTIFGKDLVPPANLWTGYQTSALPYASNVLYTYGGTFEPGDSPVFSSYESVQPTLWSQAPWSNPSIGVYAFDRPEGYRRLNTYSMVGTALAATILGLKAAWNHPAFFAYEDRWMNENGLSNRTTIAADAVAQNWDKLDPYGNGYTYSDPNSILYTPFEGQVLSPFAQFMYKTYRGNYK